MKLLGSVDNSTSRRLRPAACPRDPEILINAKTHRTWQDRTGSRGQAAGRRHLNCQHTLAIIVLLIINNSILANDLGMKTYQMAGQNCHAPKVAGAIKAPEAFSKKAWGARFKQAKRDAKNNPARYQSAMDYLLYQVKTGKGLMHHGGLCQESTKPHPNCSDEVLKEAILYMNQPQDALLVRP